MKFIAFIAPGVAAAVLSYLLAPLAGKFAVLVGALDQPGPRKIHDRPIPRLGGLAVVASVFIVGSLAWWMGAFTDWPLPGRIALGVGLGVLPIVGVSIRDDIKAMRPGPKFVAHLIGAGIAVSLGVSLNSEIHLFGGTIYIGMLAWPLSVLWIVGATNAFNIVDGLDGLSAGLALISAVSLAGVFLIANQTGMAAAVLVLAGALGGFLPFNAYPARMFLGDTGATAAGFCLAAFALRGGATLSAGFATLLPVFVLGLPIAETLISMARRILKRVDQRDAGGVFEPDRNHMHHRLLALGIDHPQAVLILYAAGVCLAAAALASMLMTARDAALLVVALLLAGLVGVRRLGYDEFALIRNGTAMRVIEAPALNKTMFVVFVDLMIVAITVYCAIGLKTDDWNLETHRALAVAMFALLAPIKVTVFSRMGLYRGSWRLAAIEDFTRAFIAVLVATAAGFVARMCLAPQDASMSLFAINGLVATVLVIGSRAAYQIVKATQQRATLNGAPTLIYGAGRKGASALRELLSDGPGPLRPVGFIDDDPNKAGKIVNGVPVVGTLRTLEHAIRKCAARAVLVSSDAIPAARIAEVTDLCDRFGIALVRMQISFDLHFSEADTIESADADALASAILWMGGSPADLDASPAAMRQTAAVNCCPGCHSHDLYRSHTRNMMEDWRKRFGRKRLYRCRACNWRGWLELTESVVYESLPPRYQLPPLEAVDAVLR